MSDRELKKLLEQLQRELARTESVSAETLEKVRELDADIHKLVASSGTAETFESIGERARALESRFAVNHPVAERFMAQIVDILSKTGI